MGDSGSTSSAIDSSNIGFQLLKRCGWTEGTGLGAAEQGRLEPLQAHVKNDKRGLGAEEIKRRRLQLSEHPAATGENDNEHSKSRRKGKTLSKRVRKMQEKEKILVEKEFERSFCMEFWPDNV